MRSAKEAVAYMKKIHTLVRYLEICDGNMAGRLVPLRCERLGPAGGTGKVRDALRDQESQLVPIHRESDQLRGRASIDILESGGTIRQETRLYDPDKGETRALRSKEEANDYRYFPDPDLLPVVLDEEFIESTRRTLPELPDEKAARYMEQFGLPAYDAGVLTASREMGDYYERVVAKLNGHAKLAANWVMGELSGALNKEGLDITQSRIDPERLAGLLARIADETISGKIAKDVFEQMWSEGKDADEIIEAKGLKQITDTGAIEKVIDDVMAANPKQLADYRSGKDKLFGFFVGQVMKQDRRQGQSCPSERAAEEEAVGLIILRCRLTGRSALARFCSRHSATSSLRHSA
jgi:aspartyl/glutamyl-tRNA(Asn/Gln) amidotransferase subunit B (EC 6.3.5.-)